jgi:hypothetical protein
MSAVQTAISWTTEQLGAATDPAEIAVLERLLAAHENVADWEREIDRAALAGDDEWIASAEIAADEAYEKADRIQDELNGLRAR